MRTYDECIPCIRRNIGSLAETLTDDPELRERIVASAHRALAESGMDNPPPYFGQKVHRAVRAASGNPDPYREVKRRFNDRALELYPSLKETVRRASDPFRTAVMTAIAGNVIDFGVGNRIRLLETIERLLGERPAIDRIAELREAVDRAGTVLFLGDNAGETVMDRILIEEFGPGKEVIYAVRGGPVLNDATAEDAIAAGLDRVAAILSNGSDAPGTILADCTEELRDAFRRADLVVSKGMGNYETLTGVARREIFFLLLVKCDLVARHLGCPKGSAVVHQEG